MSKYYICSPLSAPTQKGIELNQAYARGYVEMVEERCKVKAVAPHIYLPEMLDDNVPEERALALEFGLKLLMLCDKLVICGDTVSSGMAKEIAFARGNNIEVIKLKDLLDKEGVYGC